jgi:hypothetical protein
MPVEYLHLHRADRVLYNELTLTQSQNEENSMKNLRVSVVSGSWVRPATGLLNKVTGDRTMEERTSWSRHPWGAGLEMHIHQ